MARVVLRSEETAGAVSIIELSSNAGWPGPPLHRHDFDEAFYVTEGELTFQLGEEVFTRGPGGLAFAPRNVAHTYANHSDAPARAARVHAGRLRALLRADGGGGDRRRAARVGAAADAAGRAPRPADRAPRVRRRHCGIGAGGSPL